ncbi:MAG: hypothetical protein ABI557_05195 [Aureliella sp.]
MNTLSIDVQTRLVRTILRVPVFGLVLLGASCSSPTFTKADEPTEMRGDTAVNNRSAAEYYNELQQLVQRNASTRELLDWLKRAHDARELATIVLPYQLPWTTWIAPGWRLDLRGARGEHLLLASGAGALVAIREGTVIEMSAMDLVEPRGSNRQSRYANGASRHHVRATSANNLAAKSPHLAPLYYYFAGPSSEVLPSQALPQPSIDLIR